MRFPAPFFPIQLVFVFLLGCLPLALPWHGGYQAGFYNALAAFALGLLPLLVLMRGGMNRFRIPYVAFPFLAMAALITVQGAAGLAVIWQPSVLAGLALVWAALLVAAGAELRRQVGVIALSSTLAWALVAGGILMTALMIARIRWPELGLPPGAQAAGYLAMALLSLRYLALVGRLSRWLAVLLAVLLVAPLVLLVFKPEAAPALPAFATNLELAREAWHIFIGHPWLGAGFGQFGWQDFLLAQAFPGHSGVTPHANNIALQLMAETGIAGLLVLLAGVALAIRGLLRAPASPERGWVAGVLGVVLLLSLVDNLLWQPAFLGLAALLLGMGANGFLGCRAPVVRAVSMFAGLSGVVILVSLAVHYGEIDAIDRQAASISKHPEQVGAALDQLEPLRRNSLLAHHAEHLTLRLLPDLPEIDALLLEANGRSMRYLPEAQALYRQSMLLALAGREEIAMRQLRLAMLRHPEGLHEFSSRVMRRLNRQTLPLVVEIIRHNRAELGLPPEFEIPASLQ